MANATFLTRSEPSSPAGGGVMGTAPERTHDVVLSVRQLRKVFLPRLTIRQSLSALLGWRSDFHAAAAKTVLHDISFDLHAGQALALIGRNGSGKSTLLKIINGSLLPDAGAVECRGRISAIIELGAGFDPQATGRQNMAMQAALWGLSAPELAERADAIIDFSELGAAIDEPVAHYSSGMLLRLAFSIAIAARSDLLIIDEALAVGDVRFQQKCIAAVRQHIQRGGALLFVSHDLNSVKDLCDRALVLEEGRIIADAAPVQASQIYLQRLFGATSTADAAPTSAPAVHAQRWLRVTDIRVNGQRSTEHAVEAGSTLRVAITVQALQPCDHLCLGIMLHDVRGLDVFGSNTALHRQPLVLTKPGQQLEIDWTIQAHLGAGQYTLTLGVHDQHDFTCDVDYWAFDVCTLHVLDAAPRTIGICRLPCRVSVQPSSAAIAD